jgi:hypothetical protein
MVFELHIVLYIVLETPGKLDSRKKKWTVPCDKADVGFEAYVL